MCVEDRAAAVTLTSLLVSMDKEAYFKLNGELLRRGLTISMSQRETLAESIMCYMGARPRIVRGKHSWEVTVRSHSYAHYYDPGDCISLSTFFFDTFDEAVRHAIQSVPCRDRLFGRPCSHDLGPGIYDHKTMHEMRIAYRNTYGY